MSPKACMPAEGNAGFFWQVSSEQNRNVSLEQSQQGEQDTIHTSFFYNWKGKKSNHDQKKINSGTKHRNSQWPRRSPGLSCLCVHQLHLHIGGHATPVASLGLHLVLNGADRVHPTEQVTWPHVSCVHEVCGLSNHTSVNPPAPFRLRLFCNTAVETQPEFTHADSPSYKWAPMKFPNLNSGSLTKHASQCDQRPMMPK